MASVVWLPIGEITPNPENPRHITAQARQDLINSIREFPQMLELRPGVITADGLLIAGNMRYEACIELGKTHFPVIKATELTAEQVRQFIIKDNLSYGDWDIEQLASTFDVEELADWGLRDIDWSEAEEEGEKEEDSTVSFQAGLSVKIKCETKEEHQHLCKMLKISGKTITYEAFISIIEGNGKPKRKQSTKGQVNKEGGNSQHNPEGVEKQETAENQ